MPPPARMGDKGLLTDGSVHKIELVGTSTYAPLFGESTGGVRSGVASLVLVGGAMPFAMNLSSRANPLGARSRVDSVTVSGFPAG